MLDSGNNQSLVTGLKVLGQLLVAVRRLPATYDMTIIGQYYWHTQVLLDFIAASVVWKIHSQLNSNSFKTCRLQCIETMLLFAAVGGEVDAGMLAQLKEEAARNQDQASFPAELLNAKPSSRPVSIWRKLESTHSLETAQ
jgi:hypothetical protein